MNELIAAVCPFTGLPMDGEALELSASPASLPSGVAPIIFLLIACGSGLLNSCSSYLIILLFILFGGCLCKGTNMNNYAVGQ